MTPEMVALNILYEWDITDADDGSFYVTERSSGKPGSVKFGPILSADLAKSLIDERKNQLASAYSKAKERLQTFIVGAAANGYWGA